VNNFHLRYFLSKTILFANIVSLIGNCVIKKSCFLSRVCGNSLGIPSNMKPKVDKMTALLRVISLVVISVVVIIIPPCGAALGRGKA
jgi:hypothetical protein